MRSKFSLFLCLLLFGLVIEPTPMAVGATDTFITIDYPGAANTWAMGINAQGDIVGYYNIGGIPHGFFLDRKGFSSINYPGACGTQVWAINPARDVVGFYYDPPDAGKACATGKQHGFLLQKGNFTSFDVPEATLTGAFGINPEGDIVGHYWVPSTGRMDGFLLRNGSLTTYAHPYAAVLNKMTCGTGINPQGEIVGHYLDANGMHGFLLNEEGFTTIDIPGGVNSNALDINPEREIVGGFTELATNRNHGFILDKWGLITQIDVPGAVNTTVNRINSNGELAGQYKDSSGKMHGFLMLR